MLIAARNPPGYSVLNPCERIMSTLNIGLNGLALGRDRSNPNEEKKLNL